MIKATGSQIIVKLLEAEGIDTVAGLPGGYILPLYDELNRSSIKHVLVRQEQAAGFIAQGMTRSTGKPAVCMVTSGPGAMNLLTAIADARCDSVPIIAFTGQVNTNLIGTDGFQEADTFGLSFPITKHSMMIKDPKDLLTAIPLAFSIAVSGRPGPVLIDLPKDVQTAVVEFEKWPEIKSLASQKKTDFAKRFLTPKNQMASVVKNMAESLVLAKKPVLFVGGGCNDKKASAAIKDFSDTYKIPVVTTLMGIGAVPRSNKNNLGMVGMHGTIAANRAMHDADLVFALGVRFDDRATGLISQFCPDAKILHVDLDAAEINKILPAEYSLVCDVETVLSQLASVLAKKTVAKECEASRNKWIKELADLYSKTESDLAGRCKSVPKQSVNPRAFIRDIPLMAQKAGVKESNIIVTTDVGQHQMWSAQYYPVEHPRQFLTSGSLGTMGFGLPCAIGAALANKNKRVVCISGDGSILMNIQELITLAEEDLNVTVFVLQNGSLGMVRQQQMYLFNKNYSASEFKKEPDFLTVAKGFGIDAIDANADPEWYKKAFTKGPHLVRLNIHIDDNVLPFVAAGHANIDPIR